MLNAGGIRTRIANTIETVNCPFSRFLFLLQFFKVFYDPHPTPRLYCRTRGDVRVGRKGGRVRVGRKGGRVRVGRKGGRAWYGY